MAAAAAAAANETNLINEAFNQHDEYDLLIGQGNRRKGAEKKSFFFAQLDANDDDDDDDDEEDEMPFNQQTTNINQKSFLGKFFDLVGITSDNHTQEESSYMQQNANEFNPKHENWLFDRELIVQGGLINRQNGNINDAYLEEGHHSIDSTSYANNDEFVVGSQRTMMRKSYGLFSNVTPSKSSLKYRKWRLCTICFGLLISFAISLCIVLKLLDLIEDLKFSKDFHQAQLTRNIEGDYNAPELRLELDKHQASHWLVSNQKCHIPIIEPWHNSISAYVRVKEPLNCDKIYHNYGYKKNTLSFVKDNQLHFAHLSLNDIQQGKCCYKPLNRSTENDDKIEGDEKDKVCIKLTKNGEKIQHNLIKLECPSLNYTNYHSFIIDDPEEVQALKRISTKRLKSHEYYNIVLVGVDTISRLNGYRQLKKTLQILSEQYETLDFFGYNKVGENTFPNLIPLLTGLRPEQLTETQCWLATNYSQESERGDDYLDNCKYLWNFYQDIGYTTYFSEDWPKASTFNYLKQGFKQEPTSFYMRPFTLARDKLLLPPVNMGCASCLLDKPIVEVDLENLKTFLKEHTKVPHFAFQWINCPQHDDLNGASQVDHILEKFFKDIHDITQAKRTFVIFFSDHGYRWNDFVSTRVGHYESSLPLLTIAAPKEFIKEHPDLYRNLKQHQSALLTPFDMFKTLVKIRNLAMKEDLNEFSKVGDAVTTTLLPRPMPKRNVRKAISSTESESESELEPKTTSTISPNSDGLNIASTQSSNGGTNTTLTTTFKQLKPIDGTNYKQKFSTLSLLDANQLKDLDRSCSEAGIPDNYCVCHEFEKINVENYGVKGAAYYYVYVHLYERLKNHEKLCHYLDLELIHEAEYFDFKRKNTEIKLEKSLEKRGQRKKRADELDADDNNQLIATTTTPMPTIESIKEEQIVDEHHFLPNIEYNIRASTLPGKGLFQEVIRFYGNDKECYDAVKKVIKVMNGHSATINDYKTKHEKVIEMNRVCKFSIHSDSISRLNLYKDQSKCVKSNIELKKICYC